ncbi:MAG: methyl-accepting chemotaxis protein [Bacillota bacterium]
MGSSLKYRILIPVALVLVLSSIILTYNSYTKIKAMMSNQEQERYNYIQVLITGNIDGILKQARFGIESVVNNPEIQEAFANRDRDRLLKMTAPIFDQAKKEGVAQFQFHLAPATSFLRLHMPQKFGDDLSSFRKTVVESNSSRKIVEGLEEGRGDFGFRVVAPVFYKGNHVGSAEYGIGFDKKLLESWQKATGGQLFVYRAGKSDISWVQGQGQNSNLLISTEKEDIYPVSEEIIKAAVDQNIMKIALLNSNRQAALIIPLRDYSGKVTNYLKMVLSREEIIAQMSGALRNSIFILVVTLAVITILMYIIVQRILSPVYELRDVMEKIGKGDLSANIVCNNISKDEIGQLVTLFCQMQNNVKDLIRRIADSSQTLAGASQNLTAASQQTSATIQQVTAFADSLALSTKQLAASSGEIFSRTQHAYDSAGQGKSSLENLLSQVRTARDRIQSLSGAMDSLGQSSGQINQIVSIITDIADQTNLLALNASIEAARAGEHGRGFAVVADEVRKLAEQSGAAASRISSITREIQLKTGEGLKETASGVDEMEKSVQLGQSTREQFDRVAAAVENVVTQVETIASASGDINKASQQMALAMEKQSADVESITETAAGLAQIAGDMNVQVHKFKL